MKSAVLFSLLSALVASAAPAPGVQAAAGAAIANEVVSAPPEAFTAPVGAPGGPMPGAPQSAANQGDVLTVTAKPRLGLTSTQFNSLLGDLLQPWFTYGPVTQLSNEEVQTWRPLAELCAASYCPLDRVNAFTCGPACNDISGRKTKILGTGGDNQSNPQWIVADDGERLIVTLEGTNGFSVLSWLNDIDFAPLSPQDADFPNNGGAKVHRGFYSTFLRQINDIEAVLAPHLGERSKIIVTGHSQGAALGELATTWLTLKHRDHEVTGKVFAKPRVGDRAWANFVDSVVQGKFHYMQNNADIVGMVPPIEWGFRHPSGEVWIHNGQTYDCAGQENAKCLDSQRVIGWVPNVVIPTNEIATHLGPYVGVHMGLCGAY